MNDANEQLQGLRDALKRGSSATALTLVTGICHKNHTVVRVFRGDDGSLIAQTNDRRFVAGVWVAITNTQKLAPERFMHKMNNSWPTIISGCRCGGVFVFRQQVLLDAIAEGKSRVNVGRVA